jgi:hypothetical protein
MNGQALGEVLSSTDVAEQPSRSHPILPIISLILSFSILALLCPFLLLLAFFIVTIKRIRREVLVADLALHERELFVELKSLCIDGFNSMSFTVRLC